MRQNSFSSCTSFAPFAPFLLSNDVDGKDGVGKQIDPHTQKGRVPGVLETLNLKKKKENAGRTLPHKDGKRLRCKDLSRDAVYRELLLGCWGDPCGTDELR